MKPPVHEGIWVRSEVLPNGTYGVALNVGEDRAWVLNRDGAVAYAVACMARATEAEHDAAVFALLTARLGISEHNAALLLGKDLRPNRPNDHTATEPVRYIVALGRQVGPFLTMTLDGHKIGEMTPADLRDHAMGVLNALAAADLDANLHRVLIGTVGVDDNRARQFVQALAEHWPADQAPRRAS